MASAGAIRAGGVFVEIFAKDAKLQQTLTRIQGQMKAFGTTLRNAGASMALTGAALKVPMIMAGRQAAGFEDAILAMKGAAGLAADELARIEEEAKRLADAMGVSPTQIAQAFMELTKAGMSVDDVLRGAGQSVIEFARVSGVDMDKAAVFMKQAMNVFGVSAQEAVDTLSAAADSSETSIAEMVEAFSQVASTGKAFDQSLFSVSQALVALARSGIVGEEAGTAFKTMVTKLVAPTNDAQEALARLGLTMADFRDEAGGMLQSAQIADVFDRALKKMGGGPIAIMEAQAALVDVFEQRGIKVATAFANEGAKGFENIKNEMQKALPVSQKFAITMEGISGQVSRLATGVELMAIAFGAAISGPLKGMTDFLVDFMAGIAKLIEDFPVLAKVSAGLALALVAIGTAAVATGVALRGLAAAQAAVLALQGPKGWAILGVAATIGAGAALAAAYGDAATQIAEAKKQVEALGAAGENAAKKNQAKPDEFRKPLDKAIVDKQAAAEELAKADIEFDEAQQAAIAKIQEMSNDVVDAVDGLGEEGLKAGARFQERFREILGLIDRGALNATGAEVLGQRLQAQLEAELEMIREGMKPKEWVAPDFGQGVGTFGESGRQLGVGPELGLVPAKSDKPAMPGGVVPNAAANAAAGANVAAARAGRDMAADGSTAGGRLRTSMDALAKAIVEQTRLVQAGNGLLSKIAENTGRPGAVFS